MHRDCTEIHFWSALSDLERVDHLGHRDAGLGARREEPVEVGLDIKKYSKYLARHRTGPLQRHAKGTLSTQAYRDCSKVWQYLRSAQVGVFGLILSLSIIFHALLGEPLRKPSM